MGAKKANSKKKKVKKAGVQEGTKASLRTRMVHGESRTEAWEFSRHLVPPMTSATTFRLDSLERGAQGFLSFASVEEGRAKEPIFIYDRLDEPNTMMLEEQLAQMEQAETAVSFGSGMGAISTALLSVLKSGDRVVAHRTLYGCTYSLLTAWLPRFGIETEFIDINSASSRKSALGEGVRVLYFETLSNPSIDIADLPKIIADVEKINSSRSEDNKILVIVDNTFATPWGCRPLEHGVDMVVHSLTKNISGFGTEMGGAVMTYRKYEKGLKVARKDFGAIMNPKSAWNINVHGVSTLALRFAKQQENAKKIAEFLENHKKVERVVYPGLKSYPQYNLARKLLKTPEGEFAPGAMISFIIKGNMKKCAAFVDDIAKNSYSITLAVSLGVTKTLIEVPGYMTHSAIPSDKQLLSGIDPRAIRLSLGIESAEDLISDLESALSAV